MTGDLGRPRRRRGGRRPARGLDESVLTLGAHAHTGGDLPGGRRQRPLPRGGAPGRRTGPGARRARAARVARRAPRARRARPRQRGRRGSAGWSAPSARCTRGAPARPLVRRPTRAPCSRSRAATRRRRRGWPSGRGRRRRGRRGRPRRPLPHALAGRALARAGEQRRGGRRARARRGRADRLRRPPPARRGGARAAPARPAHVLAPAPLAGRRSLGRLSGRQREIAELVALGRSNRQIATELFLAEKTVEGHLSIIFAKLGVSSRAAVAAAVARDTRPRPEADAQGPPAPIARSSPLACCSSTTIALRPGFSDDGGTSAAYAIRSPSANARVVASTRPLTAIASTVLGPTPRPSPTRAPARLARRVDVGELVAAVDRRPRRAGRRARRGDAAAEQLRRRPDRVRPRAQQLRLDALALAARGQHLPSGTVTAGTPACDTSMAAPGSTGRSSAGIPSVSHGTVVPAAAAIVGSTSIVRTERSSTRPSRCPGRFTISGTPAMSDALTWFAGRRGSPRPERGAVVGRDDDHRVVEQALRAQRVEQPADEPVDVLHLQHMAPEALVDLPLRPDPALAREPDVRRRARRVLAAVGQVAPRAVRQRRVHEHERRAPARPAERRDRLLEARGRVVPGEPREHVALEVRRRRAARAGRPGLLEALPHAVDRRQVRAQVRRAAAGAGRRSRGRTRASQAVRVSGRSTPHSALGAEVRDRLDHDQVVAAREQREQAAGMLARRRQVAGARLLAGQLGRAPPRW